MRHAAQQEGTGSMQVPIFHLCLDLCHMPPPAACAPTIKKGPLRSRSSCQGVAEKGHPREQMSSLSGGCLTKRDVKLLPTQI